jgi:hypothetical protein
MEAIVIVSQVFEMERERVRVNETCRGLYFGSFVRAFESRERVHGAF